MTSVLQRSFSGLQPIMDGLAARLGRSTAIDDPRMHLLAYSAQTGEMDAQRIKSIMEMRVEDWLVKYAYKCGIASATQPVEVPGIPDLGMLDRWCFPVRCHGVLFGFLWILDPHNSLTAEEAELCQAAASAAGEILMRERLLDDGERTREAEILRGLLSDEEHAQAYEQALQAQLFDLREGCCVFVVAGLVDAATTVSDRISVIEHSLLSLSRRIAPLKGMTTAADRDHGVLLAHGAPGMVDRLAASTGDTLYTEARSLADTPNGVLIGVGSVETSLAGVQRSFQRARRSLCVATWVDGIGPVASWDRLGIYQILSQLPGADEGTVELPEPLVKLLGERNAEQLVETLEMYLDRGGSIVQCAEELHLHRASLYHRLKRIETVTGLSLGDGQARLLLHTGIKLACMQGQLPSRTRSVSPKRLSPGGPRHQQST
jgi:sugar diacid utilization regulator